MQNVNVIKNNNKVLSTFEKVERCKQINQERLGETQIMNCGEIAFIVEYNSSSDVTVQFKSTKELVKCTYGQFKSGLVKSHFTPSVFGLGVIGLEILRDENGKSLDSYSCWVNMLNRCYSAKFQKKQPTYQGCKVCDEWLTYSNFKKWYDENYYEIPELGRTELDKDMLVKGNKLYSPQTCVFMPHNFNSMITKRQNDRGQLPIGVVKLAEDKYTASCRTGSRKDRKNLGIFKTVEEAFTAYKEFKENFIKEMADKYKTKIPSVLYQAMYEYTVDIND